MTNTTKTLIKDIRTKLKSRITGDQEFRSDEDVIDAAIKLLHKDLKRQRLLWQISGSPSDLIDQTLPR